MEVLHDRPVILIFTLAILCLCSFAAMIHILLNMRDETERAKLWLLFVFAFPALGVLLYLCCGLNRRDTLGHRVTRIGGEVETAENPELNKLLSKRMEERSFTFVPKTKKISQSIQ